MENKIIAGQFNDAFVPIMDGVTNVVKNYAYWLDKKYGECYVATPAYPGYVDREEFPVLRYYSIPIKNREPYRFGLDLLDINFRSTIKTIPFDIVHAHSPFTSGAIAWQLAKKNNIPFVATFHSKFYDDFKQVLKIDAFAKICTRIVIESFTKVDQVWTVSKGAADTLREYGYKGKVEIVPNGSDFVMPDNMDELVVQTEEKLNLKSEDLVFLFVGQHVWHKNLRLIVDALQRVARQNIPYKMFFVGDGYAQDELLHYVREQGLSDRITLLGKVLDRDYLRSLFARADLFLFPSVYDNAPIVVQEAAAVGTPSLVIAGSNAAEGIIDNVNGFFSDNDSISYANRIIQIVQDREVLKSVGEKARVTVYRNWESIVDEVHGRYLEIIRGYKRKHRIT